MVPSVIPPVSDTCIRINLCREYDHQPSSFSTAFTITAVMFTHVCTFERTYHHTGLLEPFRSKNGCRISLLHLVLGAIRLHVNLFCLDSSRTLAVVYCAVSVTQFNIFATLTSTLHFCLCCLCIRYHLCLRRVSFGFLLLFSVPRTISLLHRQVMFKVAWLRAREYMRTPRQWS